MVEGSVPVLSRRVRQCSISSTVMSASGLEYQSPKQVASRCRVRFAPFGPVRHQPWAIGVLDELRERNSHGTVQPIRRRPSVGEIAEHLLAALAGLVRSELADLTERYASVAPVPRVEAAHTGRLHP